MKALIGVLSALVLCVSAAIANPSGGGGSAVYPVMALWAQDYAQKTGEKINYQPIGSGGGIRQSLSRTIDFGNSDMPMPAADLDRGKLVQFPILFITIVPVVNLPGVAAGALTLDGSVLADIYAGRIARWNDPAIVRLNPQLKLPALPIIVVHRADASGTTFHFTSYLSQASSHWKTEVGAAAAIDWPIGSAAKGNGGVVAVLQQTRGAIGYVEYAYAQQSKLAYTSLINHDGVRVSPSMESFRAAAAVADFSRALPIPPNPPGPRSWPLTAASYMLLHADGTSELNRQIVRFLAYAYGEGRGRAEQLHYVPLPGHVVEEIKAMWAAKLGITP